MIGRFVNFSYCVDLKGNLVRLITYLVILLVMNNIEKLVEQRFVYYTL